MPDLKKTGGVLTLVVVIATLSLMTHLREQKPAWVQYEKLVKRYETVRKTESSELYGLLKDVVLQRSACYSDLSAYDARLIICRKQYMNGILEIARKNIKSAPSLGDFMLCVRDCPLAFSMCRGADEDGVYDPSECMNVEVQCVEWCLDAFWRGDEMKEEYSE